MKKILLLVFMLIGIMGASAADTKDLGHVIVKNNTAWPYNGYVPGQDETDMGLGVKLPASMVGNYAGCKIIGFRVGWGNPNIPGEISLFLREDGFNAPDVASQKATVYNSMANMSYAYDWNEVKLDTPYEIPQTPGDLYMGYYVSFPAGQVSASMSSLGLKPANSLYFSFNDELDDNGDRIWFDAISQYNALLLVAIVEIPDGHPNIDDDYVAVNALKFEGIIGNVGETVAIGAKVLPADATDPTISWSSSNPEVAAIDAEGVVWFNAAGNATVTAECQGHEFSVPFVVKEVIARALNVFPVEAVGNVGHEFSLLAIHEPENTTDKSVTWESSDPAVATVSEDGHVSLAALGSAQITARSGEHTAVCSVTVDNTVGLTEMAATGVVIDIVEGGIVVRNAPMGESIAVYTVDGKVANGAIVESDETKLNLAAGIYIVKVSPSTVAKVLVK